jgi:hypothetical protein
MTDCRARFRDCPPAPRLELGASRLASHSPGFLINILTSFTMLMPHTDGALARLPIMINLARGGYTAPG